MEQSPEQAARPNRRSPGDDAQERAWLMQMASSGAAGRAAWEQLFLRYHRPLLNWLRKTARGLGPAQHDDLLQDIALALYEKAGHYDAARAPSPWVFSLAKNRLIDWFRLHDNSRVDRVSDDETMEALLAQQTAGQHAAPSPVVPQQVIDECRDRHWQTYARQHPRGAEAVYLCSVEGWTMGELAEFLGMTVDSTKVFVHRERAKIRAALQPCEPGPT